MKMRSMTENRHDTTSLSPEVNLSPEANLSSEVNLSPEERQARLLQQINSTGRVLAGVAAQEFGISEDSIRRDLKELCEAGLVQRFHGGASRLVSPALDYQKREKIDQSEKRLIGQTAATLIPDAATLLVDSSTTVMHFVRTLAPHLALTIITPSPEIANCALDHPKVEIILLGGKLNRLTRSVTGAATLDALRNLKVDFCILGTCGIDDALTVRADDYEDAFIKAAMIRAAHKTLLLATHEKLGRTTTYEVASVSAITTLVTSKNESPILHRILDCGVELIIAS